jgi:hypothetical protein
MMKSKFGTHVRRKSERRQVDGVIYKVLCHIMCVLIRAMDELGIEQTF